MDDDGDDLGAFAQAGGDFSASEVSPAGGVDADVGDEDDEGEDEDEDEDEDEIGAGDLGEGVEDFEGEDATPSTDRALDKGLKETFPASDPVSINPGAD